MASNAASKMVGYLPFPLAKEGLRGVVRPKENLPQTFLSKEGGKK